MQFNVPEAMSGLFERGAIGAFLDVRFADIAGSNGMEVVLTGGRNLEVFNAALRSGEVAVKRLRFLVGQ